MNKEELNNKMAKVMGWHKSKPVMKEDIPYWIDENGIVRDYISDWNPCEDMNQAVMCAEKWISIDKENRRVRILIDKYGYACVLSEYTEGQHWTERYEYCESKLSLAICQCIYEA